jgi:hypothetical protein
MPFSDFLVVRSGCHPDPVWRFRRRHSVPGTCSSFWSRTSAHALNPDLESGGSARSWRPDGLCRGNRAAVSLAGSRSRNVCIRVRLGAVPEPQLPLRRRGPDLGVRSVVWCILATACGSGDKTNRARKSCVRSFRGHSQTTTDCSSAYSERSFVSDTLCVSIFPPILEKSEHTHFSCIIVVVRLRKHIHGLRIVVTVLEKSGLG